MRDVTFLIKTFERPDCLRRLVASIKRYYESARILVVDDSREPTELSGVQTLRLPYDVGISAGRNAGLQIIDTPYFVLLDDDYEFTSLTRIGWLRHALQRHGLDLVGGSYFRYETSAWEVFEQKDDLLFFSKNRFLRGTLSPWVVRCDWTINFFLASTEAVRRLGGWDENLKVMEHAEFFVNALGKAKIGSVPAVQLLHHYNKRLNSPLYREMRFRTEFNQLRDQTILKNFGFRTNRNSPPRAPWAPWQVFRHYLTHRTQGTPSDLITASVRPPLSTFPNEYSPKVGRR